MNKNNKVAKTKKQDIRDVIFRNIKSKKVTASISFKEDGIVSGIDEMAKTAKKLGLDVTSFVPEGTMVSSGGVIAVVRGSPKEIAMAEDFLIGLISKPSGIATAARKALELSKGKVKVVCGAWKKLPFQIKKLVRNALTTGGIEIRISSKPFIYLDKNYISMFGSIESTLESVREFKDMVKVIQIKGKMDTIENEAIKAVKCCADIIFVDTGNVSDLEKVSSTLRKNGVRQKVKLAFGGAIKLDDIPKLCEQDVDILDIGRAILDAPMLDVSFDVECSTDDCYGTKFIRKNRNLDRKYSP